MNTLRYQRQRLIDEIIGAREQIRVAEESLIPDLKTLQHLKETIARNTQLICMIDYHLACEKRANTGSS